MGIKTWLEHSEQPHKPEQFCIRKLSLRYPMTREYNSKATHFMNTAIDRTKALMVVEQALEVLKSAPWMRRKGGSTPPRNMLATYFAVVGMWGLLYNGTCPYDDIKASERCPDPRTKIYISHGDADQHVDVNDTIQFVELMREKKWANEITMEIWPEKAHAGDYNDSLSEKHRNFLES